MMAVLISTALKVAVASLIAACLLHFINRYLITAFPASVPRIRDEGKRRFSWRTRWAFYTDCDNLYQEVHEKYSKQGKTCVIPFMGLSEHVVLPARSLQWLARQPNDKVSAWEAFVVLNKGHYTTQAVECLANPWQGMLVKTQMNNVLEKLATCIQSELTTAFDYRLGTDERQWVTLPLHYTMRMIVSQLSSSFSVGEPLCRDEQYLKDAIIFGELSTMSAGIIGHFPPFLHPVIGRLICIPIRLLEWRTSKKLKPILDGRLGNMKNNEWKEPEDRLQMMLRYAEAYEPHELNAKDMTGRMITANFGAMHQTSYAVTNSILNIVSSDAEYGTIRVIRNEIKDVLHRNNGQWTKTAIVQMVHIDSIIKETLRLHGFTARVLRVVTAKDGIVSEDGVHIPHGTCISILQRAPHLDPENFSDPMKFDPFRFSRNGTSEGGEVKAITSTGASAQSFVNFSPSYLPFGTGKHACPGRFLVDFEVKMIIAYLFSSYDVKLAAEHGGIRPPSPRRTEATFPPRNAKIEIKKRAVPVFTF